MTIFAADALRERTIVVTGASSGIGRAVSLELASLGARLIVSGRDEGKLSTLQDELSGRGHIVACGDLLEPTGWGPLDQALTESEDVFGLVHCAGTQVVKPLRAAKAADYRAMYEIHVVVAAELIRRVAQRIGARGQGSVVLVSSVSALRGGAGVGPYAAAKAGVIALARTAALELARQHIRVNCLVPGMVPTGMSEKLLARMPEEKRAETQREHPLGLGKTHDVATSAAFLMTEASSWITGAEFPVDGGFLAR